MNWPLLEKKLLAAARAHPPSDRVPYAFEKRIMARLAERAGQDRWSVWAGALWRAAAPCLGITLLLGVFTVAHLRSASPEVALGEDLETTLIAALSDGGE